MTSCPPSTRVLFCAAAGGGNTSRNLGGVGTEFPEGRQYSTAASQAKDEASAERPLHKIVQCREKMPIMGRQLAGLRYHGYLRNER
jgi:hypothetical protein